MYPVLISTTAAQTFRKLTPKRQERIRRSLVLLQEDPLRKRAGADIKRLEGTRPTKHRLRVGECRIVYLVDKKTVRVLDIFLRKRGYRE